MTQPSKHNLCGWCGKEFNTFMDVNTHIPECEVMLDEMKREQERDEQRRLENQLWEEEHAAGRI